MEHDIIVYDIETQESFQQVGSRDPKKLHVSVMGMYSYNEMKYFSFTEAELPSFFRRLELCDFVVGFNNKGFDDQVIAAYFPEMAKVASFDILEEVQKALGFRIKLDNIAHATLGTAKSGDGLQAIELFKEGKIEELTAYCMDDVKITREVYEYGKQNGLLRYADLAGTKTVSVDFNRQPAKIDASLNLSLF